MTLGSAGGGAGPHGGEGDGDADADADARAQEKPLNILRISALEIATGGKELHDILPLFSREKVGAAENGAWKTLDCSTRGSVRAHARRPGPAVGSSLDYVCGDSSRFTELAMF